jgi:hypothetical protein
MIPNPKDEWSDLEAMIQDMGEYAWKTGAEIFCNDLVGSHYGFGTSPGGKGWYIRVDLLDILLLKIENPTKRAILKSCFATAAGRQKFLEALPNMMPSKGPSDRFSREDPI